MAGGDVRLDDAPSVPAAPDRQGWLASLIPAGIAAGLAVLAVLLRWRGSDLPAHFFRVELIERDGIEVWNNYWFGGHHTLGYGILFPLSAAVLGIWTVAVASSAASAFIVDRLLIDATGRRHVWASLWFAAGTVTNVAVGRLPFALGLTVGLAALLAARHRRLAAATALTVSTAAASPVVSAFLAIVFTAWAITLAGDERRRFGWLVVAAVGPVLAISALYPQGGTFPFRWTALVWTLVVCAVVAAVVRLRLVRVAAGLYALASLGAFLVPSPLGANITRLGMYAAGPVLLVSAKPRVLSVAMLPLVWFWQWSPAFDAVFRAGRDPSTEASYYRPLLQFFDSVGAETERVEIVPTARHWEAAYVAPHVPIARGWERQLDMRFHPLFYEEGLDATEMHQWLVDTGVRYVALSDAPLDDSGVVEAELIERGVQYLRPIWRHAHWRVWEVRGSTGLVDGRAEVVAMHTDSIELDVREVGDVLVRVRESAFWASDPVVCIEPTEDGSILLRDAPVGRLTLYLDEVELVSPDDPCAPD